MVGHLTHTLIFHKNNWLLILSDRPLMFYIHLADSLVLLVCPEMLAGEQGISERLFDV